MSLIDREAEQNFERQCYTKICTMKDHWMLAFIDERKVIASDMLAHAMRFLVHHCENHREYSKASPLIKLFKVRDHKLFLAYWFCDHLGLKCFQDGDEVRFKRSSSPPNPEVSFKDAVARFLKLGLQPKTASKTTGVTDSGSTTKRLPRSQRKKGKASLGAAASESLSPSAAAKTSRKKSKPPHIDMLDAWGRLPGSYGTGKRR